MQATETFAVIQNTPGYLPWDDEPPTFEDYSDAVTYLNEVAKEYEEGGPMGDGSYSVEYGWASQDNLAAVSVTDHNKTHDLGIWISVVRWDETE